MLSFANRADAYLLGCGAAGAPVPFALSLFLKSQACPLAVKLLGCTVKFRGCTAMCREHSVWILQRHMPLYLMLSTEIVFCCCWGIAGGILAVAGRGSAAHPGPGPS